MILLIIYTPTPLHQSSHCIDVFLHSCDILFMGPLPIVYIINLRSTDTFTFTFVENLCKNMLQAVTNKYTFMLYLNNFNKFTTDFQEL